MTTKKAIEILQYHNKWRRGAEIPMLGPKEIGEAMDKAIEVMKSVSSNPDQNPKK